MDVAEAGGEIARNARMELEAKTGKAVISPLNAKTGIAPQFISGRRRHKRIILKVNQYHGDNIAYRMDCRRHL